MFEIALFVGKFVGLTKPNIHSAVCITAQSIVYSGVKWSK